MPAPAPQDPDKIVNPFERVATLIVNQAQDLAQRLSDNLSEAPANSRELTPDEVKAMWYYSPAGSPPEADAKFWQVHDQVLAQTGDHVAAEQQAMQAAYPKRPILAAQGNASAERQVALAEAIRKQVDGEHAPDSAQAGLDNALHATQVRQAGGNV
jgi:hypothetical protein